jgi:benzoate membrane transport protein
VGSRERASRAAVAATGTGVRRLRRNLRDLPGALTPAAWLAGLVAVLIAYTGPLVLVVQAAQHAGLDRAQLASWIGALAVGSGLVTLPLCLWYRQPIVVAWSVAGSALLVGELARYPLPEAVGAYLAAGLAVVALGWSGLFRRLLALIPGPVVLGMLAGVLLRFGTGLFVALPQRPLIVVAMLATFLLLQRLAFRAPTVGALAVGLLVAALTRDLHLGGLALEVARPHWVRPAFTVRALLGLALPLFVLAVASQDAPGLAVLRAAGYDPPVDGAVLATGVASVLTAPFGGHGLNLAALMGAICAGPEAGPDPDRRYGAGVAAALWFLAFGACGATAATLFAGFPPALVAATAGLAMTPALVSSLAGALAEPDERLGAVFALLLTAADIHLLGIGAPFWGLVLGALTSRVLRGVAR